MKIKNRRISKSALAVTLALCMLLSCVYVGLIPTNAARVESEGVGAGQYNRNWGGTVYFRVPDQWDLGTYSNVYCVIRRSADSTAETYSTFKKMSVVGDTSYSRLYKIALSVNHSTWNQNEFIAFCASDVGNHGEWSTRLSGLSGPYTQGLDYGTDSGSKYMFRPSTETSCTTTTTNNPIEGFYNADEATVMKHDTGTHYAYAYTNGSSSSTGGTTSIKAYYLNGTTPQESTDTKMPTASYENMMEGCKVTLTATAKSGATFGGWYSDSSLTTRVSTSATYSYYSYNSKKFYAKFTTETTYSVQVLSEDTSKGTVDASTVSAGSTAVTIPTARPKYGYKFKQWVATSPAAVVANATSATAATVRATGTGGKVTAQFEPDTSMNLYIAGRFRIRQSSGSSNWVNSFASGSDWSDTGAGNIKFTYDSGTTYKLETYASVKELSTQISNQDPYFFVYDSTNSTAWHTNGNDNTHLTGSVTTADLSTNNSTFNVRFNDTDNDDSPVTISFNVATKELSYDVPNYYSINCNPATGGSVTADAAKQKEGQTVTLTLSPSNGYTVGSVTVTKAGGGTVTVSGSGNTRTFVMPAGAVTVSATFTETKRTVTVYKRYTKQDGTVTTDSTATQTITNVGVVTTATVSAAGTVANYSFSTFTVPSTVTVKTGSASTSASFTITATANSTIYIDYTETLYTLTLVNQGSNGTIKKSGTSTAITSIQVGNVTGVTLVATPNNGYQFAGWEKTTNAAAITIGSTSNATTTFKISAAATVTAKYSAVPYTISATGSPAAGATSLVTTDTSGGSKTGGTINDLFEIRITVNAAAGYALADNPISFQTGTGYAAPTLQSGYPTTSGNTVTYRYKLNAGSAVATVSFKAATPTISTVRMRDNTHLATAIDSCTSYANNATVNTYYKQPVYAKATTSDAFTSTFSYATKTTGGAGIGSSSTTPCTIAASTTIIPTTETGYAEYKFTVTATNAPSGVTAATTTYNYTIRVYFNDAQKAYFKLGKLIGRCISISDSDKGYFTDDAPISTYNNAYSAAKNYYNNGNSWPAYNASTADTTTAQNNYNTFNNVYTNLMTHANLTTVYVLTNYANSSTAPVNVSFTQNNSYSSGYSIARMYNYDKLIAEGNESRHTTYGGYVTKSTNRYFYTITYAGRANLQFWRGTSASESAVTSAKQLTGVITGATPFKENYVNVYATTAGSSATSTAISLYADFDHTIATGKKFLEIGDVKTAAQIKTLFSITPSGSMVTGSNPGITVTNTAFTIEGPIGKSGSTKVDMLATGATFTAATQGRYTVKYTSRFGYNASNAAITRTKEMTLYVAFDDVTVYVDMNDNVGTPILNFKYKQKNEVPVASGTSGAADAYLPYEMELVTGSESIYKYTIKTSKLRDEYFLSFDANNPLNISYITVERTNIGASSGGFDILSEARITGEIWFKANSTHLTTFQTISCGSVTKSFVAAAPNGTILSAAMDRLHGTGINTDVDEIYKAQYAGLYKLEGAAAPMNNFHYVLNAAAKQEVTSGNNTYYFDKWVKCSTANVSYNDQKTTVTYTNGEDDSNYAELSFVTAPDYGDGENDVTYIALYKLVGSDNTVRVEITYKFKDFDTSDGNVVYDANKETVDASYTKTVKSSGTINSVKSNLAGIAEVSAPYVKSNYFDYSFGSVDTGSIVADDTNKKITVNATLTETPHPYRIILKKGNAVVSNTTGYYQQTVDLASGSYTNPVWKDSSGNIIGSGTSGSTFKARYVSSGNEMDGSTDCQIIKVENGSSTAAAHKSVVSNAYTEVYYSDNGTQMLRHNFYIIDYCTEGTLKGGGVLFATTDGTNYRQANAATVLANATSRKNFISGILGTDFDTEYAAQTINNVGFRYKPFKSTEDVFRYSDNLGAYITTYEGSNVNSDTYDGQTLRLFSFMVYDNNGTAVIVPSDGYAEVSRYQPQS